GLQLLWAMDRFRDDNKIFNTALATETLYAASVSDSYFWDYPGPFCRAFASVRETAVESRDAVLSAKHWNHLAAIYDVHYGVQLEADNYADCGNDDSFNVQDALTIEGWITPRSHVRRYQVILSKFEAETSQQSYELGINEANRLYLKIRLSGRTNSGGEAVDESLLYFQVAGSTVLEADRSYFVAATVELEENTTEEGKIEHSLAMRLYCDGQEDGALEE